MKLTKKNGDVETASLQYHEKRLNCNDNKLNLCQFGNNFQCFFSITEQKFNG